uniref:Uncharacterized protein n=1 Tax=Strombidium inclinatum TaxID=197538 RepID=A0A7S3ILM9_9SPIT|mmetsp:Transcript_24666/g.38354  ORF Transcript_24666/g.38354 Transcript_24666/m.38354 type:complete len:190 (+) Transcript_24666:290-859(+)
MLDIPPPPPHGPFDFFGPMQAGQPPTGWFLLGVAAIGLPLILVVLLYSSQEQAAFSIGSIIEEFLESLSNLDPLFLTFQAAGLAIVAIFIGIAVWGPGKEEDIGTYNNLPLSISHETFALLHKLTASLFSNEAIAHFKRTIKNYISNLTEGPDFEQFSSLFGSSPLNVVLYLGEKLLEHVLHVRIVPTA